MFISKFCYNEHLFFTCKYCKRCVVGGFVDMFVEYIVVLGFSA